MGIVGKEIRCSIFKADVERRLVYSVIAKARYRRYSGDVMSGETVRIDGS